jgi:hypothetical protein
VAVAALVVAAASLAGQPPPKYGQLCYKGAWETLLGTSGPFASQDACVQYANKGGVLYPKTPTSLTSVISGPENGIGALVGNPQSRTAGGFTDPAMRFTVSGEGWVPGTISLTYTAAAPLNYTYTDPTSYMSPPAQFPVISTGATGTFSSFFQDNCFDGSNVLVSGLVPYTITATGSYGQTKTVAGTLNCDAIPATVLASTGPIASPGWVKFSAVGWHFTPNAPITLTYSALGTLDGLNQPVNAYFTVPNANANGFFTFDSASAQLVGAYGDNCYYDTGSGNTLQTTDMTFTMTASDGTHTATATGVLKCSLLAP